MDFNCLQTSKRIAAGIVGFIDEAESQIQKAFDDHASGADSRIGELDKALTKHKKELAQFIQQQNDKPSKCSMM